MILHFIIIRFMKTAFATGICGHVWTCARQACAGSKIIMLFNYKPAVNIFPLI